MNLKCSFNTTTNDVNVTNNDVIVMFISMIVKHSIQMGMNGKDKEVSDGTCFLGDFLAFVMQDECRAHFNYK